MNTIETLLQEKQKAISDQFAAYAACRPVLDAITAALEPSAQSIKFPDSLDFHIVGNKSVLVNVFRILRTQGWETHFERPKEDDPTWVGFWYHPDCSTRIWLNFASSVCKRVQVGTALVEQPIYEVRCNDT